MGDALEKGLFEINSTHEDFDNLRKTRDRIFETHTEELIIVLCGPIGTDIHFVANRIAALVEDHYAYKVVPIRLSDFIKQLTKSVDFSTVTSKNEYYHKLIEAGNKLREKHGSSILAEMAINEIAYNREIDKDEKEHDAFKSSRICYIIDSIRIRKSSNFYDLFIAI